MPQYMLASYLPDDFDPSSMTAANVEAIHALNREINAAGAERFAFGLAPASGARTVRQQGNGTVTIKDGPFTETKEHVAGVMILEAANLEEALAWARKGILAGGGQGVCEVRELLFFPDPKAAKK